jgi:L-threonylcarbamoyladenylate synthase
MLIPSAVEALRNGQLVAFPTETVYGLGADGTNPEALRKLFATKGRPLSHPVILHLGERSWLEKYAHQTDLGRLLIKAFWPGPLTLILPRTENVPDEACGGQDNVGLRMPSHPLALELLRAFGKPLAAPSANRFGRISPTKAEHVSGDFGDSIAGVLDGGPCEKGLESTVLDLSKTEPAILRPGSITASQIEAVIGRTLGRPSDTKAPGTLKSHYSPVADSRLASFKEILRDCQGCAVLSRQPDPSLGAQHWLKAPDKAELYARTLYDNLRYLDSLNPISILIEEVPDGEEWDAIRDRLQRATY